MDSDDNFYDSDSPEFHGGGGDFSGVGNGSDSDAYFIGDDDRSAESNFAIFTAEDIRRLMEDDIGQVVAVLSVSKAEASALLRRFNWSVNRVHEEWFADEARVRSEVGLVSGSDFSVSSTEIVCGICFDDQERGNTYAAACGHNFCVDCWCRYIGTAVEDGPGCLNLRCPDPDCKIAVDLDAIERLASKEDKKKYFRFLLRSYVEENRKIKWCTAPGCDFAIGFEIGSENSEVLCACGNFFCWNCAEEAHRPVDCETVNKWIMKNNAESENTNWILAYTKPCPKCKRPIEKGEGCMKMTCKAPCNFQFCWLCLNDWKVHGYNTCNKYTPGNETEKQKERAKMSIERYTHYYERWAANEKSKKKSMNDLREMESVNVEKLSEFQSLPQTQLKFIVDAWKQIVECRRVLKWTYAYGYYLPEEEHAKRQFFEYLQGQAEVGLERLHQCAEKELEIYLDPEEANSPNFGDFRIKLTGLTSVTKNYFENLVSALENGLEDVDSQAARDNTKHLENEAGSSNAEETLKNISVVVARRVARLRNLMGQHGITARANRPVVATPPPVNNNGTADQLQRHRDMLRQEIQRKIELQRNLEEATANPGTRRVAVGGNRIGVEPVQGMNLGARFGVLVPENITGAGVVEPRQRANFTNPLQVGPNNTPGLLNIPVAGNMVMEPWKRTDMQTTLLTRKGSSSSSSSNWAGVEKRSRKSSESAGSSSKAIVENAAAAEGSNGVEKRQRTSPTKQVSITDQDDLGAWTCDLCTYTNPGSATVCTMCADDPSGNWECDKCTFVNTQHVTTCQMCELPR